MRTLLFERPWLLLVLLAALQFVLIAIWSRWRTRPCGRAVWIGFAAMPSLLTLSAVVVTPRERVIDLCRELASLVDLGDVDAVALLLSEDFAAGELDREAFLRRAKEKLTRFDVDDPRLRGFEVTFAEPGHAVVVFNAVCRVRSPDAYINQFPSRWRMSLSSGGRAWKVTKLEALPTPFSPVRHMRELLR